MRQTFSIILRPNASPLCIWEAVCKREAGTMAMGSAAPNNTSSSCITVRSQHVQEATSVSIGLILVVGTPLNGLALWVFSCRLHSWTEARIYMINLVVADCLLLLSLPGVLLTMGLPEDTWCRVAQSFYYVNTYMSMGLVTAIAVDRYAAVCFPLRSRGWRCPRQAAGTCGALWLLVTGAVALLAYWLPSEEIFCFGQYPIRSHWPLLCLLLLFFLLLPVLTFCSIQVLRQLLREWKQASPQRAASIHKAFCVVAANLATFLLCFLPLHGALLAKLVVQWMDKNCFTIQKVNSWIQAIYRFSNTNCCLDAFGYYFVAREFQEEVSTVLSLPWPFRRWNRDSGQGQEHEGGESAEPFQRSDRVPQASTEVSFLSSLQGPEDS